MLNEGDQLQFLAVTEIIHFDNNVQTVKNFIVRFVQKVDIKAAALLVRHCGIIALIVADFKRSLQL